MLLSELIKQLQELDTAESEVVVESKPGEYESIANVERGEDGVVVIVTD